jgi:hypothetical protein
VNTVNDIQHKENHMVHTSLIRLLLVLLAPLLAGVTAAHASTPMAASGSFATTSTAFGNIRCAGGTLTGGFPPCSPGNTIIDVSATVTYTGTFDGTLTLQGSLIFHPDGSATTQDIGTFSGAVNGVLGTVTLRHTGRSSAAGIWQATDVVLSATDGLADLHGVLDEVGSIGAKGPVGSYTGQIEFGAP